MARIQTHVVLMPNGASISVTREQLQVNNRETAWETRQDRETRLRKYGVKGVDRRLSR